MPGWMGTALFIILLLFIGYLVVTSQQTGSPFVVVRGF